jgi:hypothetical protein
VVHQVVDAEFVLVGRDEPFERMVDENEFGEIARPILDRVVQSFGVQDWHGIFCKDFGFGNGRQVVGLYRPVKNQHESHQIPAGHLQ